MNEFDIVLNNNRGRTLYAHVTYVHPDQFLVEIDHLKLKLKVYKNVMGRYECEDSAVLHSNLVTDICNQINARLYTREDSNQSDHEVD